MNKNSIRKLLSFILCIVLIAAMALIATGCKDNNTNETPKTEESSTPSTAATEPSGTGTTDPTGTGATEPTGTGATDPTLPADVTVKGEGATAFNFQVQNIDGTIVKFLVKTDKTIVGEALLEVGLITGDPGPYGLYVKSVNGITADYDTDGTYWAFYENGNYAAKGVDTTTIDTNVTYSFVKTAG